MSDRYDLVVLGGGTAGLVSAFIAAGVGARVALIERERTGGDCLWTGCVPSKSLIATAHLAHRMRHADRVGLTPIEPQVDFTRVMDRVHATIAEIEPHDSPARLRAAGVEVIEADGRFTDAGTLEADGRRLRFSAAIVATGSQPSTPPIPGLGGDDVFTTDDIWHLRRLPARLIILGGGPVGCELGQAFARLGANVTIVELADRLLLKEEPDAGALVAKRLTADGIDVRLGTRAIELRRPDRAPKHLIVEDGDGRRQIEFDAILVVAGRRPRTDGAGLQAAGVQLDKRGAVVVDQRLRTSVPRIYAAGDVTASMPFTHVAAHHARVASINALLGMRRTIDQTIPWVTFTDPEVARVGLTEAQARARHGDRAIIARSDYATLDRAITEGENDGFALLVADPKRRLVGATIAGPGAGEVIAELTAHIKAGNRIDAVSTTVHAYPTLAEGPSRAADEHLRERYAAARYRAAVRPVLAVRRALAMRGHG
ncbi:FAD-dependent oxidoreductase [Paraconexibacter antarcticus]|uniref:FAD-dependent oxidoreductase n=1 Tax=Paraconexibacter antarcticus TaxID=2949664 RepID=A0ABY5DTP0_9ACTN|nr:FAD-dependent oxidoreductase [Paraconexibacter antarcticus]UTI64336.1 FAD-dependent oxidoreductase [Paraconexibacter antarcticus]